MQSTGLIHPAQLLVPHGILHRLALRQEHGTAQELLVLRVVQAPLREVQPRSKALQT